MQAYGVLLSEEQEFSAARAQFKAAATADEYHLPVWQAWAVMEFKLRNYEKARQLFQRGVWAAPKDPNLVWLWQVLPTSGCQRPGCTCMRQKLLLQRRMHAHKWSLHAPALVT